MAGAASLPVGSSVLIQDLGELDVQMSLSAQRSSLSDSLVKEADVVVGPLFIHSWQDHPVKRMPSQGRANAGKVEWFVWQVLVLAITTALILLPRCRSLVDDIGAGCSCWFGHPDPCCSRSSDCLLKTQQPRLSHWFQLLWSIQ